ncbi:hypothetical protein [Prauserella muralis]|uniref:Uncharacterized protein n=1 Tax=Prauserella muralis TaxID=588067 RepID=A0A2V4ANI5_9PSEU|nr:hypothetical protein [Prauserella muralis]PXY22260.1 hypothetical protein BAY60_20480 [Prauserella muralis]TWE27898.1 hypothetical protein FHX69_0547 [Prauserella muralis]
MILPAAVARGVARGTVTLAFRRWARQNVRQGDTLTTPAGVIAIGAVTTVDPAAITDTDAARAGASSAGAVLAALRGDASDPVFRIELSWAGPDPRVALSADDTLTPADVAAIADRLGRLDRRSAHGPWTHDVLRLIAAQPGRRAAELAASLGRDRDRLKLDIRKLKQLGLTHSLDVGYRISPRGAAYLAALDA